jgi:hypothetical protein
MKQKIFTVIAITTVILSALACSSETVSVMTAEVNPDNGQYLISESGRPVLQYNYQTVYETDVVRPASQKDLEIKYYPIEGVYVDEYYKANPAVDRDGKATSAIWAIPRSDYIHPLYGPDGEMLTNDWPDADHPHHRGIFWAWPEVEYGSERGDLYALQRIFSRPTGRVKCVSGSDYAEIEAENRWIWEERKAIVREWATIRACRASKGQRIIDLTVRMQALVDSVTIATRFTNSYGGLNIRMATPKNQNISHHSDTAVASPRRCWANFDGVFEGAQSVAGMTILQHRENPEYPGKWIDYPNLSWVQPTFPTPNTRYPLAKGKTLTLRYRLIVHQGGKPDDAALTKLWDEFNSTNN